MAKINHITVTTLRLYDELDLLSQFTIADKVILNKPMMIIGESGDIGQLQWYVFYSTLITRFAQSPACFALPLHSRPACHPI